LADEARLMLGELLGREVVVGAALDDRRQPGVGQAGDRRQAVLGEMAEVLAHLHRPGGAVEPEDVGAQRLEGGEGGSDLGADKHAAGRLHGDLDLEGHAAARGGHGPPAGDHGRLRLQEVVTGLDEQEVDADLEERAMEVGDDVGPGVGEDLVAPLVGRSAEVVGGQVARLEVRAGGAVVDHDVSHRLQVAAAHTQRLVAEGRYALRRVKIYTKKGDDGTTGLLYGGRVRKDAAEPEAYGA